MATRTTLKGYFETNDRPTQAQFASLIDSAVNNSDDKATVAEAQAGTNQVKYITPETAKASVLQNAPVKTVNGVTPVSGNVALAVANITGLNTALNNKQDLLVSGTNIKSINGVSLLGSGNLAKDQTFKMASSQNSSSTSRVDVPTLSFGATAGQKFLIHILGEFRASAVGTGGSIGFMMSAGAGAIRGSVEMQGPSGPVKSLINAIGTSALAGSFFTNVGVPAANTGYYLDATFFFECTTAGNFKVQWGSNNGGTATLAAGTSMIVSLL